MKRYVVWWSHQVHTYPGGVGLDNLIHTNYVVASRSKFKLVRKYVDQNLPADCLKVIEYKPETKISPAY